MDETSLAELMHEHGERWQITRTEDPVAWLAVRRPAAASLPVLAAPGPAELDARIRQAEQR